MPSFFLYVYPGTSLIMDSTADTLDLDSLNNLTNHTIQPSGRQQSITTLLLKTLSHSSTRNDPANNDNQNTTNHNHHSFLNGTTRRFLEDLALRSKNGFLSKRRVFHEMPDGFAFCLFLAHLGAWIGISLGAVWHLNGTETDKIISTVAILARSGPFLLLIALTISFISSWILYKFTRLTIHVVSLSVLGFMLYNASFNLPHLKFTYGNFASLLTFLFLALYYKKGQKHLALTCHFIESSTRICWRNHVSLVFVFASYSLLIYIYFILWSSSILCIQNCSKLPQLVKSCFLTYSVFSLMIVCCFCRDLLQIWLSRIIYMSTFAYTSRPVMVTSLTRKLSMETDGGNMTSNNSAALKMNIMPSDNVDLDLELYEATRRIVSRESMWWCMGTAARSAFHLVLRGFQVHIWILALLQVFFPSFGPPADPKCVLDVFHVPTAIYGTSFTKSRRFVADTMVDHGMDRISVDIYLRTFIYYMMSYTCVILGLLTVWFCWQDDNNNSYRFKISFLIDCIWSLFTSAQPIHFVCLGIFFGVILFYTAIDSVYMILCWAICETPTSVSALEPELMHSLVSTYHARLDLKRFTGDRIHTTNFSNPTSV